MNLFLPSRYVERVHQGAVALQLWDGALGGRLRDRIDLVVEREEPLTPPWLAPQFIDPRAMDEDGRPRLPRRNVHRHGLLYGRQRAGAPKTAIEVRVYDRQWRFAPRRLRVPIPPLPEPASGAAPRLRIRRTALYPGPAYDVTSCSTGVRGRVLSAATGAVVRWPRVIVHAPPAMPPLAPRPPLAVAHGDQHGEFLLLLPPHALIATTAPAGAASLALEIAWRTLPAAPATRDRLDGLPVEIVGPAVGAVDIAVGSPAELPDWMAMGWQLPPEYASSITRSVTFTAGRIHRESFAV